MTQNSFYKALALSLPIIFASACSSNSDSSKTKNETKPVTERTPQPAEFTLNFKAMSGDLDIDCNNLYQDLGPDGAYSIGVDDLRLYISNLKFYDNAGQQIPVTLDSNDFQLNHEAGSVSLIDFTNKESGYCEESPLGTPRTNTVITGTAADNIINAVSFDVGVPQALMKSIIADSTNLTDAPSPMAEMVWSWASGYKHIDLNFTAMDANHTEVSSNSVFHLGSRDCGTAIKDLSEQEACGLINTPKVMLSNFDPANNVVTIDLATLFANTTDSDYTAMIMGPYGDDETICINEMRVNGMCAIGSTFGAKCHSMKTQSFCQSVFSTLGIDIETGESDSSKNTVFGMQ